MPNTSRFACEKCGRQVEQQTCPRRLCPDCWGQTPAARANRERHAVMAASLKVAAPMVAYEDSPSWAEYVVPHIPAPGSASLLAEGGDGDDWGR